MSDLEIRIMVKAFKIRLRRGESFDDIVAYYTKLKKSDISKIKLALNMN